MDYEKIILELMVRVKTLEEQVENLTQCIAEKSDRQPGTSKIKEYIDSLKKEAALRGDAFVILKANDIHKSLNLKSRMPAVCNAMKQCMINGDEILHKTASGFSSTFEIKYYLKESLKNEK